MSLVSFFGGVGSFLGKSLTSNQLSAKLGSIAGSTLAKKLQHDIIRNEYHISHESKNLDKINIQTVRYGREIPIIYGNVKLAGNIIWASGLEKWQESAYSVWQKNRHSTATEHKLTISLAIAICEGPIDYIENIWIDNQLIDSLDYNITIYPGTEDQLPDPVIAAKEGNNRTPAFRGLAYILLKDFPVNNSNKIPNFTFTVRKNILSPSQENLENMITAVCLQPSCGEFIYDTKAIYKFAEKNKPINLVNKENITYAQASLDNLKITLPNVEWLALPVCWFSRNIQAAKADILPAVESQSIYTEKWKVANFSRENAHKLTHSDSKPVYGGTTNDQSIIRYLSETKKRGIKIMLHPQIYIDNDSKNWRGDIFAESTKDI